MAPDLTAVCLRRVTECDAPLLVRWRNENAKFFPPQPRWTIGSHLRWYRTVHLADPCDNYFLVLCDSQPAGTVSLTVADGEGEIGRVMLAEPRFQGRGVMRDAITALMTRYGLRRYWLVVYRWNEAALGLYRSCGFTVASEDGEWITMERL